MFGLLPQKKIRKHKAPLRLPAEREALLYSIAMEVALGQMAQGWYSYSHPKDENIVHLKNL